MTKGYAKHLFDDWFSFFLARGEGKREAWFSAVLMVAAPIFFSLMCVDFTIAVLLRIDPIAIRVNRWLLLLIGGAISLLVAATLAGRLSYDAKAAEELALRRKPRVMRMFKIITVSYIMPLIVLIVLAVTWKQTS